MKMRKGFTLVELLIVIIIIGILAAAMLLSSGSATEAAKASNAVSEMRSLKGAAIMIAAQKGGMNLVAADFTLDALAKYMDSQFNKANFNVTYSAADGKITIKPQGDYVKGKILDKIKLSPATDASGNLVFSVLSSN